jgi:hypothetical protein
VLPYSYLAVLKGKLIKGKLIKGKLIKGKLIKGKLIKGKITVVVFSGFRFICYNLS